MLVGQKDKDKDIFSFPRALFGNRKGFTLIEILVSVLILGVVLAALFIVLNIGDSANYRGLAKVDLQANVRQVVDLIVRDVRQTVSFSIDNNTPSNTYIKFQTVEGTDTGSGDLILNDNYTEYNYDSTEKKITRSIIDSGGNVLQSRDFFNITEAPFRTIDGDGNTIDLIEGAMSTPPRLVIIITGQAQLRGSQSITFTLQEEVRIRNG